MLLVQVTLNTLCLSWEIYVLGEMSLDLHLHLHHLHLVSLLPLNSGSVIHKRVDRYSGMNTVSVLFFNDET